MNKFETTAKTFEVKIPALVLTDPEEIWGTVSDLTDDVALINIKNYVLLYNTLNEQYPVNIHQFCKFIPAEYRTELKHILS